MRGKLLVFVFYYRRIPKVLFSVYSLKVLCVKVFKELSEYTPCYFGHWPPDFASFIVSVIVGFFSYYRFFLFRIKILFYITRRIQWPAHSFFEISPYPDGMRSAQSHCFTVSYVWPSFVFLFFGRLERYHFLPKLQKLQNKVNIVLFVMFL